MIKQPRHTLSIAAVAVAMLFVSSSAHAVFLRGQPYIPAGANFSMFAVQGITPSAPTGITGVSPQVNGDFEFANSIGVSYDQGNGQLKDFGLGLYQDASHNTQSTGLRINYNAPVDAFSVKVTLEDFDIKSTDTGFNKNKVEPGVLIFGANGNVLANADPTKVFSALTYNSTASSGKGAADVWDLDFSKLFANLNLGDQAISGFLLYADMLDGEKANSDPYLLVSVGNGIPMVPEAGNYLTGAVAIAILGFSHLRFRRQRKAVSIS